MSSGVQVARAIDCVPGAVETNSSRASLSNSATAVLCPAVLLVGRNGSWGTSLLKSLAKFDSGLSFATPESVVPEYARSGAFHLILLDSTVSPVQRRQLVSELIGSEASIFYTFPVENGCWWLPALRRGQDCHGEPAFRRTEFPLELERIFQDQTET